MNEVVPGVIGTAWFGISAPAKTPQTVIEILQGEITRTLQQSEVQQRLVDIGMSVNAVGSAEFTRFIASEISKWRPIIERAKVKIQ